MSHYYDAEQRSPLNPFEICIRARGIELKLWSGSGVFSKRSLDNGTKLLLDTCILEKGWRVHDLGCGYGVVGIVVKKTEPSCIVVCSDVNARAVQLTKKNARQHTTKLDAVVSDGYAKVDGLFDTVLVNPPYVAGRTVVFRLLEDAFAHLKPGGVLQAVARHQKGGKMMKEFLEKLAGNCDDSRKGGGFRVYIARREHS